MPSLGHPKYNQKKIRHIVIDINYRLTCTSFKWVRMGLQTPHAPFSKHGIAQQVPKVVSYYSGDHFLASAVHFLAVINRFKHQDGENRRQGKFPRCVK